MNFGYVLLAGPGIGSLVFMFVLVGVLWPLWKWWSRTADGKDWVYRGDEAKERKRYAALFLADGTSIENPPETREEAEELRWSLSVKVTTLETSLHKFRDHYTHSDEWGVRELQISREEFNNVLTEFKYALSLINRDLSQIQSLRFDEQINLHKLKNIGGAVQLVMDGDRVAEFRFSRMPANVYTFTVRGHTQILPVEDKIAITAKSFELPPIPSSQLTVESVDGVRDEIHW